MTSHNYNERVETLVVPYLTPEGYSLGYSLRRGELRAPAVQGEDNKPIPANYLVGYHKVRRTYYRDRVTGHTSFKDEVLPDQVPDFSYKSNPTSTRTASRSQEDAPTTRDLRDPKELKAWQEHLQRMGQPISSPTEGE